jgi:predicted AAA+ superfamily ATPase
MHNYQRLLKKESKTCFLFGLRGSGKSTWCKESYPEAHWFNLLDEGLFQDLLAHPKDLGLALKALPEGCTVIIDEVQRLPNLLNEVHRSIEERKLVFILTGSSTRKLKRAGVNLLGGRAHFRQLFPLTPWELGEDFFLDKVLEFGSLPLIQVDSQPKERLKAYVQLFLLEEIRAEAITRNLPGFTRFLSIAALCNGQVCNVSSLARESGVSRSTVSDYFSILEDTHMGFYLPGYDAKIRVRERVAPKWIWTDPGIVRTIKKNYGPLQQEEKGHLFEAWLICCIRAWNHYQGDPWHSFSYWQPLALKNTEVDLLLENDAGFTAIEIKGAERFRPDMLKGLMAIKDLPRLKQRILVYLGPREMLSEEGILILPLGSFLAKLDNREFV